MQRCVYLHRKNVFVHMKTLFLAIILIAFAVVAMAVKVIFVKGGRFPSGHAHDLPALKKRGVGCASQDVK